MHATSTRAIGIIHATSAVLTDDTNWPTPSALLLHSFCTEQAVVLGAREGHWSDLPGLAQCMRASMLLPGICGPPITLDRLALLPPYP